MQFGERTNQKTRVSLLIQQILNVTWGDIAGNRHKNDIELPRQLINRTSHPSVASDPMSSRLTPHMSQHLIWQDEYFDTESLIILNDFTKNARKQSCLGGAISRFIFNPRNVELAIVACNSSARNPSFCCVSRTFADIDSMIRGQGCDTRTMTISIFCRFKLSDKASRNVSAED